MGSWGWYRTRRPRRPANGLRAKTERGAFGKTWWAGRWVAALEKLMDSGRLSRGRSYARRGQVLTLDIKSGHVTATVQGSMPWPYEISIRIQPLSASEWAKVTATMAAQAIFAAQLLAGEMPQNIEEAFAQAGVSLFPAQTGDLKTSCSCPDYANPCKHIAAVYFLLGEQFDEDPFLIFTLRGRTREQIMAALRAARTGGAAPAASRKKLARLAPSAETVTPLAESLAVFWEAAESEPLQFALAAPALDAALVKRLGEPAFWQGKAELLPQMEQAYRAITAAALALTLGD